VQGSKVMIFGAGGVARGVLAVVARSGCNVFIVNRDTQRAESLVEELTNGATPYSMNSIYPITLNEICKHLCDIYINCTPVGMIEGSDPDGLSIPIPDMPNLSPDTVFFDTVYNPIETPMLKSAKERGYRTIDGVQMFVKQAAAQFELWTGKQAPEELFDTLVRTKLGA
jgi:3-dehydroquinate dehydratase/shikimate dehydrogenase